MGPALQSKKEVSGKEWGSERGEMALAAVCLTPGNRRSPCHLVRAPCSWVFSPTTPVPPQTWMLSSKTGCSEAVLDFFLKPSLLCFGASFQDIVKQP